jgi:hypothetical protein
MKDRYHISLPVLLTLALVLSGYSPHGAAAKLYKWVDENGQIHYGSSLPADKAKNDHQQLNKQGVVVNTKKAKVQKSEEELALEAEAKRIEEERLAEEARLKEIQDQKDRVLLMTFSNEDEINHAREDRIKVVESVIDLIHKNIAATEGKLAELQKTADQLYTSQGKEIPGGMAQKIEHFERKIENRKAQLAQKQEEKAKINEKYDVDLARFRELKSDTN